MAVQNFEMWAGISGDQDRRIARFLVTGAADEIEVLDHMEQNGNAPNGTPFFRDGMPRENITVTEISAKDQLWYSDAYYTRRPGNRPAADTNTQVNPATGNPASPLESDKDSYSFEVSVENVRETFLDQSAFVSSDVGTDKDGGTYQFVPFDGLAYDIAYGFRGRDILRPRGSFSLTITPEDSKVTRDYQATVQAAVGKVNSTEFRTHVAGEVMLMSARGSARNLADWEFTFNFEYRTNPSSVDLGNGVVATGVQGWDLLDPYYETQVKDIGGGKKAAFNVCRQVIVWRPYQQIDFNQIINPT